MVEATKSKVMSGTPQMNSIKITQTDLRAGIFDRRPNAKTIPIGKENEMPVIPMMIVNEIPPNLLVSTYSRPNPPLRSHAETKGKAAANHNQYFFPGSLSLRTPTMAIISKMKERLTRHFSVSGYQP